MFKIPDSNKKITVANKTDLFGNIYATKNINFDSEGVIKLAEGSVAVKSENGDTDFDTPVGFGRYSNGAGMVATLDKEYILDMDSDSYSVTKDTSTNTPTGGVRSHAVWWQDRWYQTQSTSLVYAGTSYPTWVTSVFSLTSGVNHPLCLFKNRNTMVIGNGNVVAQIDTSHSTTSQSQLTLPPELEVTSIAYNNNRVIIGTKNKTTNNGSGGTEAFLFIWDGITTEANIGLPTSSDYVLAVSAYQESSFICLTGTGQILKFNGSGLDTICSLPFYFNDRSWTDYFPNYIVRNGIIKTDGDVIYFNLPNELEYQYYDKSYQLPNFAGGIYCYDPNIGLYHRCSPSMSLTTSGSISSTDSSTDTLTSSITVPATGIPCRLLNAVNTGLIVNRLYYVIKTGANTLKLATSYTNALAGTSIDFTGASVTTGKIVYYNITDFGQFITSDTGLIDILKESSKGMYGQFIFGGELFNPTTSTSLKYATLGLNIPDIETRGWIMTPKIESPVVKDNYQKLYIKFKPLEKDIDKIVIKYRTSKRSYLPLITPNYMGGSSFTGWLNWTDSDTFTTDNDLTYAQVGDEIEITAGNGGGQTSHILSLTNNAGTWTVELDEPLKYITASEKAYYIIDNWQRLDNGTIDSTNTEGLKEIAIGQPSKWIQFKIELRGVAVEIEELQIINSEQIPSK
jgi:hypothetical protein